MKPIRRQRQRRNSASFSLEANQVAVPIVRLWLLRMLVPLGAHSKIMGRNYLYTEMVETIARALELEHWIEQEENNEFDRKSALKELTKLHRAAEKELKNAKAPDCLANNIKRIARLAKLSETDCRLLEFATLLHVEPSLEQAAAAFDELSSRDVVRFLSALLALPHAEIRSSLGKDSALTKAGLVRLERSGYRCDLRGKLELLSESFIDEIVSTDSDPMDLLRGMVSLSPPPQLTMDDYPHLEAVLSVLRPYLEKSLATGRAGVNILLYGPPGTGKTQLTRVLAQWLDCELFQVATEDEEGDPIRGSKRLRALQTAQSFFAQRKSLVVLDEAEDGNDVMGGAKGWLHSILEENPAPAFWLANSILFEDNAPIRRFDFCIELPVPPKRQRKRILRQVCPDSLADRSVARLAESEQLAPAVAARAAAVVNLVREELGEKGVASAYELLLNNTLAAQGHRRIRQHDPNRLPETYDPRFIHANIDVNQLAENLKKTKTGRLCLHGPSGAGKTAYARWLSEQLDLPLLIERASDLIDKHAGETEKNIARAFWKAEADGALLLIDEVEGFLQDRRKAKHGWEVTSVNEMLTQMEAYPGLFIASTNLMEGLDQASLRRFDEKIKFDFLLPEQAWDLFKSHCASLGLALPRKDLKGMVQQVSNLTPGNFATLARQHNFHPITSPRALLQALEHECGLKEGKGRRIGFV